MDTSLSHQNSLIVVPLGTTFLHAPLISHELTVLLESALAKKEKTLLLYNRRGFGRAWICQDCGYYPLCPNCDIALAYHTSPQKQLICHHCSHTTALFLDCPSCGGQRFQSVGIGIQEIESHISRLFPRASLLRVDSDKDEKKQTITNAIEHHDIILATYASLGLIHSGIHHIVSLLFESELTLPDYRMEEELYHTLEYLKKSGTPLMIQTYTPEHPLLTLLLEGNYKDFLTRMSSEREKFDYPPYTQFALLRIHDERREKVEDMVARIVNKIETIKTPDIFIAYDKELHEKYRGEWSQKIILKGKNLDVLIRELEVEILRNRSVTLEWR